MNFKGLQTTVINDPANWFAPGRAGHGVRARGATRFKGEWRPGSITDRQGRRQVRKALRAAGFALDPPEPYWWNQEGTTKIEFIEYVKKIRDLARLEHKSNIVKMYNRAPLKAERQQAQSIRQRIKGFFQRKGDRR